MRALTEQCGLFHKHCRLTTPRWQPPVLIQNNQSPSARGLPRSFVANRGVSDRVRHGLDFHSCVSDMNTFTTAFSIGVFTNTGRTSYGAKAGLHAASARPLSPALTEAVTAPAPAVGGTPITLDFVPDGLAHVRPRSRACQPPGTDALLRVEHVEVHYLVVPPMAERDVGASILREALRGIYIWVFTLSTLILVR